VKRGRRHLRSAAWRQPGTVKPPQSTPYHLVGGRASSSSRPVRVHVHDCAPLRRSRFRGGAQSSFLFDVLQTKSFALSASRSATRARGCFRDPGVRAPPAVPASAERIFSKTSSAITRLQKTNNLVSCNYVLLTLTSFSISQHIDQLIAHRENSTCPLVHC
jgi:hypothetical protein